MLKQSQINNSIIQQSILSSNSQLGPKKGRIKKTLAASLILTSLVDAFTILVVYLLNNFSSNNVIVSPHIHLPMASQSELSEKSTMIKLEQGHYFINDKIVSEEELPVKLTELVKKQKSLSNLPILIQADKQSNFKALNQIFLSASLAGINKYHFSVINSPYGANK